MQHGECQQFHSFLVAGRFPPSPPLYLHKDLYLPLQLCGRYLWTTLLRHSMCALQWSRGGHQSSALSWGDRHEAVVMALYRVLNWAQGAARWNVPAGTINISSSLLMDQGTCYCSLVVKRDTAEISKKRGGKSSVIGQLLIYLKIK